MKFWGRRGVAAALGMALSFGSGAAYAQGASDTALVPTSFSLSATAKPAASTVEPTSPAVATSVASVATSFANAVAKPIAAVSPATPSPASAVAAMFGPLPFAKEAAWLHNAGWPLYALVDRYATDDPINDEMNCLATAVYFEARGESLEGQMAVAKVVINRAVSGRYPPSLCETVKQPSQFSFVRNGQFPQVDQSSIAWHRAKAIAKLAAANILASVPDDVLWYHADYVAPGWGQRMQRVEKIGAHIFYRA